MSIVLQKYTIVHESARNIQNINARPGNLLVAVVFTIVVVTSKDDSFCFVISNSKPRDIDKLCFDNFFLKMFILHVRIWLIY